jgi:hypothetical protein
MNPRSPSFLRARGCRGPRECRRRRRRSRVAGYASLSHLSCGGRDLRGVSPQVSLWPDRCLGMAAPKPDPAGHGRSSRACGAGTTRCGRGAFVRGAGLLLRSTGPHSAPGPPDKQWPAAPCPHDQRSLLGRDNESRRRIRRETNQALSSAVRAGPELFVMGTVGIASSEDESSQERSQPQRLLQITGLTRGDRGPCPLLVVDEIVEGRAGWTASCCGRRRSASRRTRCNRVFTRTSGCPRARATRWAVGRVMGGPHSAFAESDVRRGCDTPELSCGQLRSSSLSCRRASVTCPGSPPPVQKE